MDDNAKFLFQHIPEEVKAGSTFTVHVLFLNTGTSTWSQGIQPKPRTNSPKPFGAYQLHVFQWGQQGYFTFARGEETKPGEVKVFKGKMKAPTTPGTYPLQWQMSHTGLVFGSEGPITQVNVVAGP